MRWKFFKRRLSRVFFYELEDVFKDIIFMVEDYEKFGDLFLLVVIVDNGGISEDILVYKCICVYGVLIVVIDYYDLCEWVSEDKVKVDDYVDVYVNLYYVKCGYYELMVGMFVIEVVCFINLEVEDKIKYFFVIVGMGDKSKVLEFY